MAEMVDMLRGAGLSTSERAEFLRTRSAVFALDDAEAILNWHRAKLAAKDAEITDLRAEIARLTALTVNPELCSNLEET